MKKVFATILLFSYAFASSGATVDVHFCMGKMIGLGLHTQSSKQCTTCKMPVRNAKGCCNDKQVQVNIDKDYQAAKTNLEIDNGFVALAPAHFVMHVMIDGTSNFAVPLVHGPPGDTKTSKYVLHCNFRI